MPKTKSRKAKDIDVLAAGLADNKNVVFANFFGLKVKDVENLRKKCRDAKLYCAVAKKTLLAKALKDNAEDIKDLQGEILVIAGQDEVASAKVAAEFGKKNESLKLLAGISQGKWATFQDVVALSKLPSREELLSKLVGSLNAPVSGFVNVLAGNLRGLVCALNAIKDKKVA
jgi:large subunit ribosomal protein L10